MYPYLVCFGIICENLLKTRAMRRHAPLKTSQKSKQNCSTLCQRSQLELNLKIRKIENFVFAVAPTTKLYDPLFLIVNKRKQVSVYWQLMNERARERILLFRNGISLSSRWNNQHCRVLNSCFKTITANNWEREILEFSGNRIEIYDPFGSVFK